MKVTQKNPSDFLKACELELEPAFANLDNCYDNLTCKLNQTQNTLNETFGENQTNCSAFKSYCDVGVEESFPAVFKDLSELLNFRDNIKLELQRLNNSKVLEKENDFELLGRTAKEENAILVQRLSMLEKTKSLTQKVLKFLTIELDNYQKKIDPMIESEALQQLVQSRKTHEKWIELQLNQEVKRIEQNFVNKWIKASKPKRKFERIDWVLRTELQPRISRLEVSLFQRREQQLKLDLEIQEVTKQMDEQEKNDVEYEEKFISLTNEFDNISSEIETLNTEVKQLKWKTKMSATAIDVESLANKEKLIDMNENNLIMQRILEIHGDELEPKLDQCRDSTSVEMSSFDCIMSTITKEICRMSRKIRESKIQKSKLQTDIRHLTTEGSDEIIGRDYMGGYFVKFVGPQCQQ